MKLKPYRRHGFRKRYTGADVELLATVDAAHGTLSGPATQKILQRAAYDFGEAKYERLSKLSVAQLYRLRQKPALPSAAGELSDASPWRWSRRC